MRQKAKVNRCIEPHGRDEREIAGYHDVLAPIHEQCEYINVTANAILQLHCDLMRHVLLWKSLVADFDGCSDRGTTAYIRMNGADCL